MKGYTKGEHVLRFEAIVHNTRALRLGRVLDQFPRHHRPAGRDDRPVLHACSTASTPASSPTARSTQLPAPPRTRGDPRWRHRSQQAPHAHRPRRGAGPGRRTRRLHRRRVRRQGPRHDRPATPTTPIRQAAYDLRKLRAKHLVVKPGPLTPLPRPPDGRPHDRRPRRPPRPGHLTHPRRCPQPPTRVANPPSGPDSTVTTNDPHPHADPLRRPRHHDPGLGRIATICRCGFRKRAVVSWTDPLSFETIDDPTAKWDAATTTERGSGQGRERGVLARPKSVAPAIFASPARTGLRPQAAMVAFELGPT